MPTNTRSPSAQQQLVSDVTRAAFGDAVALNLTDTQTAALTLYRAGLQVFPLPYAKKLPWKGYRYSAFRYARPRESDVELMFSGEPCNIAVQTGRISGNLLVIDVESHPLWGEYMAALAQAGVPLWAVKTHRGGHIYLRCADGEVKNVKLGSIPQPVEVHGNSWYVLGPESLHPSGVIYTLTRHDGPEPPTVTLDKLRRIFPALPLELISHRGQQDRNPNPQELDERTVRLVQGQIPEGERNNQLYTSTRELLARGYDENAAYNVLVPGAVACGLSERESDATFRSAAKNHYQNVDTNPDKGHRPGTINPRALWYLAAQWAEGQMWKGRSGSTDRAVFLALCERCKVEHPDTTAGQRASWRASVRELSELTGFTIKTISAALQRLQDRKAVKLAYRSQAGYRYTFGKAVVLAVPAGDTGEAVTTTLYQDASSSVVVMTAKHPAFDRTALGANAGAVLRVLLEAAQPLMPTAISRGDGGLSRSKVRTTLERLQRWRLVERLDEGWVASVNADQLVERLDDVAIHSGAFMAVRARRERHQQERAARLLDIVLRARGMLAQPAARDVGAGLRALSTRLSVRNGAPAVLPRNTGPPLDVPPDLRLLIDRVTAKAERVTPGLLATVTRIYQQGGAEHAWSYYGDMYGIDTSRPTERAA